MVHSLASTQVEDIFRSAGFQIRGGRATCPFCTPQHRRLSLTVAIKNTLWHCHRCHQGGHIGGLAAQQGISLPSPRVRRADIPKEKFRLWLADRMRDLANEERQARKMF